MKKIYSPLIAGILSLFILFSSNVSSACTSDAGQMSLDTIQACAIEQAQAFVIQDSLGNPGYFLDANDAQYFVLHSSPGTVLGTIYDSNTTGIFTIQVLMDFGTVYYISSVVGNNLGTSSNPLVDLSDPCLSVSVGTPVIWYQYPGAVAGSNMEICGNQIQLNALAPSIGSGSWTCLSSVGVVWQSSFNAPDASPMIPNFDTNPNGCLVNTEYIFRWTVENGACLVYDDVAITFMPMPVADAGADQMVCGLDAQMDATFSLCGGSGISSGLWSGNAMFPNHLDPNTTAHVITTGPAEIIWTESNGPCTSSDTVVITFLSSPEPNAGLDDSICGHSVQLNSLSALADGIWSGPTDAVFADPLDPNANAEIVFSPGTSERLVEFVWTETCLGNTSSDTVEILFSKMPNALAGIDDWACGVSYDMQGDVIGFEYAQGTWSSDFIGIQFSGIHDPNSLAQIPNTSAVNGNPNSFGDSSYVMVPVTWTMDNNGCIDEDEVMLTFYQIPIANAGFDMDIIDLLEYNLDASLSIEASAGTWIPLSYPAAPPTFLDNHDPLTLLEAPDYGLYTIEWREANLHNQVCGTVDTISLTFFIFNFGIPENEFNENSLLQNHPNPFRNETEIRIRISGEEKISLSIYDVLGNELMLLIDQENLIGEHSISLDASNLPAGSYYYCLKTAEQKLVKKMMIID